MYEQGQVYSVFPRSWFADGSSYIRGSEITWHKSGPRQTEGRPAITVSNSSLAAEGRYYVLPIKSGGPQHRSVYIHGSTRWDFDDGWILCSQPAGVADVDVISHWLPAEPYLPKIMSEMDSLVGRPGRTDYASNVTSSVPAQGEMVMVQFRSVVPCLVISQQQEVQDSKYQLPIVVRTIPYRAGDEKNTTTLFSLESDESPVGEKHILDLALVRTISRSRISSQPRVRLSEPRFGDIMNRLRSLLTTQENR